MTCRTLLKIYSTNWHLPDCKRRNQFKIFSFCKLIRLYIILCANKVLIINLPTNCDLYMKVVFPCAAYSYFEVALSITSNEKEYYRLSLSQKLCFLRAIMLIDDQLFINAFDFPGSCPYHIFDYILLSICPVTVKSVELNVCCLGYLSCSYCVVYRSLGIYYHSFSNKEDSASMHK